ncbi:MAG: hypothetical protein C0614_11555 [Desulfuromonas sp.]|nr:MAG: hypothetical protein C0614_11555 [Desulfuromonas sp.]
MVNLIAQYFLDEYDMLSESELVEELLEIGYEIEEIDAAFVWMESQACDLGDSVVFRAPLESHRVFTREEILALQPEARGYLGRLRSMGIVDDEIHEEIVQRAMSLAEDEVTLKEIRNISVLVLFARAQHEWRREFDCLLEGDWARLLN